jgi:hypothetical protein
MGRECSTLEEEMNAHSILVGKSEGEGSLERPICRFEINIKMDI